MKDNSFTGSGNVPSGTQRRLRLGTLDLNHPDDLKVAQDWQRQHLSLLREGGTWCVPASGSIYTVYPSRKVAERMGPEDEGISFVMKSIGWTVVAKPAPGS